MISATDILIFYGRVLRFCLCAPVTAVFGCFPKKSAGEHARYVGSFLSFSLMTSAAAGVGLVIAPYFTKALTALTIIVGIMVVFAVSNFIAFYQNIDLAYDNLRGRQSAVFLLLPLVSFSLHFFAVMFLIGWAEGRF